MSLFMMKSILSVFFLIAAVVAIGAMLSLMGRAERTLSGKALRKMHRTAGWIAVVLLVIISYFCIRYVAMVGDQMSARAVSHGVLALILIVVLALKVLVVRRYKEFLRFVPVMGLIVFSLVFVVVATSAGFFFVRTWCGVTPPEESAGVTQAVSSGDALTGDTDAGREEFLSHCATCHNPDSEEPKIGPGLAGLFARERLLSSNRPPTPENVASQILDSVGTMPSFESRLSQQEIADLVAYLKTL
jgi:cytochrome c